MDEGSWGTGRERERERESERERDAAYTAAARNNSHHVSRVSQCWITISQLERKNERLTFPQNEGYLKHNKYRV